MWNRIRRSLKRWWWLAAPLLDLYIALPFLRVRTELWVRHEERQTIQYAVLRIEFFGWRFSVGAYDTDARIYYRKRPHGDVTLN